jgi:phage-related protein
MKIKFYLSFSGRSPVEDFLEKLSQEMRAEFLDSLVLLEEGQSLSMPLSRNLSSIYKGLHELRLKDRTGAYRFFYFIKKADGIYFVHAFKKKTQELPQKEIDLVLKRLKEF